MKRNLIVLGFFLAGWMGIAAAQITEDDFDMPTMARLQAQRVAYITNRLQLTPQESSEFWAVVNEYELAQEKIKLKYKPSKPVSQMNNDEAEAFIQSTFQEEQDLLNLKKEYYARFKNILSPSKIALFPVAEREFKREVLRQMRERWVRSRLNPGRN